MISRRILLLSTPLLAVLAFLTGCSSSSESGQYSVSGTVTFEGEPIKEGRITFKIGGPAGKAFSGEIKDGSYSLRCDSGSAIVEITASRLIPGKFDTSNGTKEPMGEMYIPTRYNSATSLKADVKAQSNTIPFDLKK